MTIELSADEWKVHCQEKVSTGEYESATVDASLSGSVEGVHTLDDDARRELKARLLSVEKTVQEAAERAAKNRIREDGHEDWGVRADAGRLDAAEPREQPAPPEHLEGDDDA